MGPEESRSQINIYSSRWVATYQFPSTRQEVHTLFDELIHRTWGRAEWQPNVDIVETKDTFVIEIDLPGTEEAEVQIAVEERRMVIEGERRINRTSEITHIHRSERPEGRFVRTFEFRVPIDPSRTRTTLVKGVFTVVLTKKV